jgi:hypothetical protein
MNARGTSARLALGALALLGAIVACDSAGAGLTEPTGQPASLVKVAGDEQAVAPGTSLVDKPTVRVLDAGGLPVPGVTVAFAVTAGGGTVAAAEQTTDADGKASVAGWTLGSSFGVNTLEARVSSAGLSTSFTSTGAVGAAIAAPVSAGAAGGVLRASLANSGLADVTITVPVGAYAGTTTFTVETVSPPSGLASIKPFARLRIGNGGVDTDSIVAVRIPITADEGTVVVPYWYDEATKRIDPVPVISEDETSITLGISSFAWKGTPSMGSASPSAMRGAAGGARLSATSAQASLLGDLLLSHVKEADLLKLTFIGSGYSPRQDDWEFVNEGSELSPFGNCHGQTLTAAWYYDVVKGAGGAGLFERYAPPAALRISALDGKDNALGYRFASVVQADANGDRYSARLRRWETENVGSKKNWLRLLDAMNATGQPQLMAVLRKGTNGVEGHALVAYKASPTSGDVWVSDPNHPGDPNRKITFNRSIGLYSAYQGGLKKGDPEFSFPTVRYIPRSYVLGWDDIATRWAQFQAQSIGTVGPNTFSTYAMIGSRGKGTVDYVKPGIRVYDDSITVGAREDAIYVDAYDSTGTIGAQTAVPGERRVGLSMGANRIGAYMYIDEPTGKRFVDFQRLAVTRQPLALATTAGALIPISDTLRFDSGVARTFTLRYDDGSVAPDVPYNKTAVKAVTGSPGVTVVRESSTDAFTLALSANDTGKKVVKFELWYGSRLVRNVVATVARPSIVLTPFTATYSGARTIEPASGGSWGVLTCKMPWTAEVLGSAQRVVIGEEWIVTPANNINIDQDRVTWPEAEQVTVTEGTYKGTGTWWWRKFINAGDPPSYMPFHVKWAIRYRDVATGVEYTTNIATMDCQ